MNTAHIVSLCGRLDVHRLDEVRALGRHPVIDASGIEFLDAHALALLDELGAIIAAPSDVVRITLELTGSTLSCFPTVEAALGMQAETVPDSNVLRPGSRLDLETADQFRRDADRFLASPATHAIVDLGTTTEMDVAGLAALAFFLIRCRAQNRSVAIAGPISPPVGRLIDYSGFDLLFEAA